MIPSAQDSQEASMAHIYELLRRDEKLAAVLDETNTDKANEALRLIAANDDYGIGMALLTAWQHGIRIKHIPLSLRQDDGTGDDGAARAIAPDATCPYVFVHVPVREFRSDTPALIRRGIMSKHADPALFVYHEDGLIGTFSFVDPGQVDLTKEDLVEILRALVQHRVLMKANIDNRQIQFKDLAVKRRIEASGSPVYVRVDREPMDRLRIRLPPRYDRQDIWDYVLRSLQYRFACNYCSVQTLCPREVTINSSMAGAPAAQPDRPATVRNYQMGFTFAPVGDPGDVCHFLAWDFPHISDLVMNMEPQAYSFSDLIRLVDGINGNIARYYADRDPGEDPIRISGGCNHWAGNSIYHQHYQFMRVGQLPLVSAVSRAEPLTSYQGVDVRKLGAGWPAPALLISSSGQDGYEQVMKVADKVAREWRVLSEEDDTTYGNEIVIRNHTQNIFVTTGPDGRLLAIFIPRVRQRVSTSNATGIIKKQAGVLEMMGYFVIDSRPDFTKLELMTAAERREVGDAWLRELSPDPDAVTQFETNVQICLDASVEQLEQRIDELAPKRAADWRTKAHDILGLIQGRGGKPAGGSAVSGADEPDLDGDKREHLYRELIWALLEPADDEYGGPAADA
jgi:hypothetical protein